MTRSEILKLIGIGCGVIFGLPLVMGACLWVFSAFVVYAAEPASAWADYKLEKQRIEFRQAINALRGECACDPCQCEESCCE